MRADESALPELMEAEKAKLRGDSPPRQTVTDPNGAAQPLSPTSPSPPLASQHYGPALVETVALEQHKQLERRLEGVEAERKEHLEEIARLRRQLKEALQVAAACCCHDDILCVRALYAQSSGHTAWLVAPCGLSSG